MARNLLRLFGKFINFLARIVRFFLPLAIRGIGYSFIMLAATFTTVLKSINESSRRIAEFWRKDLKLEIHDSHFDDWVCWVVRVGSYVMLAFGWVLLAYLTVFILGLVFE